MVDNHIGITQPEGKLAAITLFKIQTQLHIHPIKLQVCIKQNSALDTQGGTLYRIQLSPLMGT